RNVAMPRSASSSATAAMNGCAMPAPAPCARTVQQRALAGISSSPDTRRSAPTPIVTSLALRGAKAGCRTGARLGGLDVAIARRRRRDQLFEQVMRGVRHRLDRTVEGFLVGLGRAVEAGKLPHELQRRGTDLLIGRG